MCSLTICGIRISLAQLFPPPYLAYCLQDLLLKVSNDNPGETVCAIILLSVPLAIFLMDPLLGCREIALKFVDTTLGRLPVDQVLFIDSLHSGTSQAKS